MEEVKNCKFSIRSIVLNKQTLYSRYLRRSKETFYNFALRKVLEHNSSAIKDAKIRIDGSGEKAFRKNLVVYLRQNLNSKLKTIIIDLKFKDSKKDNLIQLADMVAGSIRRSYDSNLEDCKVYKRIIAKRIEDTLEFQ